MLEVKLKGFVYVITVVVKFVMYNSEIDYSLFYKDVKTV